MCMDAFMLFATMNKTTVMKLYIINIKMLNNFPSLHLYHFNELLNSIESIQLYIQLNLFIIMKPYSMVSYRLTVLWTYPEISTLNQSIEIITLVNSRMILLNVGTCKKRKQGCFPWSAVKIDEIIYHE